MYVTNQLRNKKTENISISLTGFSIANVIIWIGNVIMILTTGKSVFLLDILSLDLGIISFYQTIANVIDYPIMIFFTILGWSATAVWIKLNYPADATKLTIQSMLLPFVLLPIFLTVFLLNVMIGMFQFALLFLLFGFYLAYLFLNLLAIIFSLPALFVAMLVKPPKKFKSNEVSYGNYLTIYSQGPPSYNEPVSYCPFRMKDKPGCAFLGYKAPQATLICDYESTWLRCYVYSHLYEKLEVLS